MEPIIEFKDFSFKYRAQVEPTLRDINLSIMPGEKVLIVGPSGSGKSTLAHCINGLVPFSYNGDITGSLRINGKNPADLGLFGLSKMVGTVLQDTDGQFIGLTVAEDIAFALENDMVSQGEMIERVNEVAEMVDVKKLLENAPRELSGGQKQRVSMGGVMVDDVEILLFDEPLANLDPATGKRAIDLIDKIQKKKKTTIVIIEHRLEASRRCSIITMVVFFFFCILSIRSMARLPVAGSRLAKGSSKSRISTSSTMTPPMETRCFCPPESSLGAFSRSFFTSTISATSLTLSIISP